MIRTKLRLKKEQAFSPARAYDLIQYETLSDKQDRLLTAHQIAKISLNREII